MTVRAIAASALAAVLLAGCSHTRATTHAPAARADPCTRFAAPSGSDHAPGTAARPLRSAQRLIDSLRPGETGCLRAGTYLEDVRPAHGGRPGAPITLQSTPGERARIVGRLWIPRRSDWVTIADLALDGTNALGTNRERLPSPTVNAAHARFTHDDVTNDHTFICFSLGSDSHGAATDTTIERSRIHGCGHLPPTNHDHGIYLTLAYGTQIRGNLIYDNADRGIQLYPNAQRTTIAGNVIVGNGEGVLLSGEDGVASDWTDIVHNVIAYSRMRGNVESYYPRDTPPGRHNVVRDNCLYGGVRDHGADGGLGAEVGFSARGNLAVTPQFAAPAAGDFTIPATNPCHALLAADLAR